MVVFPNCFQHHVDGFELADKSKKGHRKSCVSSWWTLIATLLSLTNEVPPQQKEWWDRETEKNTAEIKAEILKIKTHDWLRNLRI